MDNFTNIDEYWCGRIPIKEEIDLPSLKYIIAQLEEVFKELFKRPTECKTLVRNDPYKNNQVELVFILGPVKRKDLGFEDFPLRMQLQKVFYQLFKYYPKYIASGWGKDKEGNDLNWNALFKS